jgi:hypothetical protein
MSHRRWVAVLSLCALLWGRAPAVRGQNDVRPEKLYQLSLRVLEPSEKEFHPERTVPISVFLERQAGRLIYVGKDGNALAVAPVGKTAAGRWPRAPVWSHSLELAVRGWDEKEFGPNTRKIGIEVYRDDNSGYLLYVAHTGSFAVVPVPKAEAPRRPRVPEWLDRLVLRVRRSGESEFTPVVPRIGVEVYHDANTGCVVYAAESGSLAVASLKATGAGKESREPVWSHGLILKARTLDEERFGPETARVGLEVFLDGNRDASVYITETFRLAVRPGGRVLGPKEVRDSEWRRGVRPGQPGDDKWSAEVFLSLNYDDLLYVTPSGALSVIPPDPGVKK